jgi:predicted XRE-type DNA-binding protein
MTIYPERSKIADRLSTNTAKRLKQIGQSKLATILGISQPRVSQLFTGEMRSYISEAGKRDTILSLLQKAGK